MLETNVVKDIKNNEDLTKIYKAICILQNVSSRYDLSLEIEMLEGIILKETFYYDDLPSQKMKRKMKFYK